MGSFAVACFNKAIYICAIVIDTFAIHALTINFLFGKTGFIFHLRGTDSQKILDSNVHFSDDRWKYVLVKSAALVEHKSLFIMITLMLAPLLVTKLITRWRLPSVVMHAVMPKGILVGFANLQKLLLKLSFICLMPLVGLLCFTMLYPSLSGLSRPW